jgi:hypothetical protein
MHVLSLRMGIGSPPARGRRSLFETRCMRFKRSNKKTGHEGRFLISTA